MFNRHNKRYWASENPRKYMEMKKQGRTSINVWCGMIDNKVVGPIFFNGSLNGQRYLYFLQNEIENILDELPLETYRTLIWQQDGAPPHNIRLVLDFLNDRYIEWIEGTEQLLGLRIVRNYQIWMRFSGVTSRMLFTGREMITLRNNGKNCSRN